MEIRLTLVFYSSTAVYKKYINTQNTMDSEVLYWFKFRV